MVRQMRLLAYAVVGAVLGGALAGCASRPVAVAAPVSVSPAQGAPGQAGLPVAVAAPAACTTWTVHVTRHEQQAEVASCQVAPIDDASDITAEVRHTTPGHVSVHVVADHETASNVPVPRDLTGTTFVFPASSGSSDPRVASLAATVLDWPQPDPMSVPAALKAVVGLELRGSPAQDVSLVAHAVPEQAYSVVVDATQSDAGMCHQWSTVAHLDGRLTLHPTEGTPATLELNGPTWTTEAVCAAAGPAAGPPRTCTKGDIAIALSASCTAGP